MPGILVVLAYSLVIELSYFAAKEDGVKTSQWTYLGLVDRQVV